MAYCKLFYFCDLKMFTLFFLPHITKMDECISINKIPFSVFTWKCCNIMLFLANSFTRFKLNVLTSENVVVLPLFCVYSWKLDFFCTYLFSQIENFDSFSEYKFLQSGWKICKFAKISTLQQTISSYWKYTKKKVFLSPNYHTYFSWISNKHLRNPKANF